MLYRCQTISWSASRGGSDVGLYLDRLGGLHAVYPRSARQTRRYGRRVKELKLGAMYRFSGASAVVVGARLRVEPHTLNLVEPRR